jgi:uncharacterized membrane protein YkoI
MKPSDPRGEETKNPLMMRTRRLALVLCMAAALAAAPVVFANHGGGGNSRNKLVQVAPEIGPDEAAAIVRSRTGGKVLSVRTGQRGGRVVYKVKVLKAGYVRIYGVDCRSGSILE